MLGLGETLARRRGLLRAMKSLRGLEDYYRRIVFSVADQTTPRDNRVDVLTKPTITTPTRLRTALLTRLSRIRLLGGGGKPTALCRRSRFDRAANILSGRVASDCYSSGLCLFVSDSHSTVLADSCHALRRLRACHRGGANRSKNSEWAALHSSCGNRVGCTLGKEASAHGGGRRAE